MLPARYFGSARTGREPAIRSILTATVAALVGTIIGGLSVLGVVLAVVEPPNHDNRADARDASTTTGSSQPVVAAAPWPAPADPSANAAALPPSAASSPSPAATTPPATQAQASSPAPAPQPPTAAPQEQAAAPQPAPESRTAWPDALTRRTPQDHANGPDTPNQSSTAQSSSPAATANDQAGVDKNNDRASFDKKDVRDDAQKPQPPASRSVASRGGVTTRLSNTDQAGQRSVSTPPPAAPLVPAAHPAIAVQPAMPTPPPVSDTAEGSSPDTPRPLFDFFGLFGNDHFRDQRDSDSTPQGAAPPQLPALQTQYGAKARAVRQQRPNGTDQSGEATSADQQDQDDNTPRHNESWGGFFGRNDWNDNSHRW
jgi:hypothetical protein